MRTIMATMAARRFAHRRQAFPVLAAYSSSTATSPQVHREQRKNCPFGLLIDIDGVVCRGKVVLPGAIDAFNYITDAQKRFLVPTVFVTNAGNTLRLTKAERLSRRLNVDICADQVVLSHSPLRMFTQYHDKHILAVGQGPILDIARNVGFTQVTTLDNLRSLYPHLDCSDFRRRARLPNGPVRMAPIEAIVLFGEPLNWESALQYILDTLYTNGQPDQPVRGSQSLGTTPHLPVLACNTDLLWMAETTPLPRFGHGTFLVCLETLYRKLTGHRLHYTALMGKPSVLTYHYAARKVQKLAASMGMPPPSTLYAIGDNPESDILGANLFEREIKSMAEPVRQLPPTDDNRVEHNQNDAHGISKMYSMLVETGVYSANCKMNGTVCGISEQSNWSQFEELRTPHFYEQDIWSAIQTACRNEHWYPKEH